MRRWLVLISVIAVAAVGAGAASAFSARPNQGQSTSRAVSLWSSDPLPVPGDRVTLKGRVHGGHAGERVSFQQLLSSGWRTIAKVQLSRRSTFAVKQRLKSAGSYVFRAKLPGGAGSRRLTLTASEIHKIKHVVIIMQENRSFDHYFGTFPGADGIPGVAGNSGTTPCLPDPVHGGCDKPFHDRNDINQGGPHYQPDATADMDCSNSATHSGCQMDGFVSQAEKIAGCGQNAPSCDLCKKNTTGPCLDVMGYHNGADIPNYWRYADDFVLQDHMFEPAAAWSLPAHLYLVSDWSAICTNPKNPMSCSSSVSSTIPLPTGKPEYAWTDLTYLFHKHAVSWRYYIFKGIEPDCESNTTLSCKPVTDGPQTNNMWNPLWSFTDVAADKQRHNIQSLNEFFKAAKAGNLPAVSWIVPSAPVSEHEGYPLSAGQTYVTGLINEVMTSPDWKSTAIFLAWDDWSGYYDNVVPPAVDANGYGFRVPALVISPYAKVGYIDHQTLSFDAYNKFIEDDFLNKQRLDPKTDGRPDSRPDVREDESVLGNLLSDFNFSKAPRKPVILPVCPVTDLQPKPSC